MTTLKDFGICVEITGETFVKMIPAVNIQVENIPDGYGVYFEILFENGDLWVVMQDISEPDRPIEIIEQKDWAHNQELIEEWTRSFSNWDEFIKGYSETFQ